MHRYSRDILSKAALEILLVGVRAAFRALAQEKRETEEVLQGLDASYTDTSNKKYRLYLVRYSARIFRSSLESLAR